MDEKNKRIEESKATKTYEWQNADGTPRAKKMSILWLQHIIMIVMVI